MIKYKLCKELMKVIWHEEDCTDFGDIAESMLRKAVFHEPGKDYSCSIKIDRPIIGIGAPCGVYINWMRDAFDTEVIVHKYSSVGNAIGAITSSVSEVLEVLIKPEVMGSTECRFEVYSKAGNAKYDTMQEALQRAEEDGRRYVADAVARSGATDVSIEVETERKTFKYGNSEDLGGEDPLMEINMRITAAGKPRQFGE